MKAGRGLLRVASFLLAAPILLPSVEGAAAADTLSEWEREAAEAAEAAHISSVLREVEAAYVEPPSHRAMLLGALEGLAKAAPAAKLHVAGGAQEITVLYAARDGTAGKTTFVSPANLELLQGTLARVAGFGRRIAPGLQSERILSAVLAGAMRGLDPHCDYVEPPARPPGAFAGIGVEVGLENEGLRVVSPIEGAPAALGGVKRGDLIVRIDEQPVKDRSLEESVRSLQGKPDTQVVLSIVREREPAPLTIALKRQPVRVNEVKSKIIAPGYAWIQVSRFYATTPQRLARQLESLLKTGDTQGVVLDLRTNSGGLLQAAVAVAAAFLPPNAVVFSSRGRADGMTRQYRAYWPDYTTRGEADPLSNLPSAAKTVPLLVLVNGGSAAGSEIVAAALQDHRRATIAGTQTFGTGTIQVLVPLKDGRTSVKITSARVYTPAGHSFQATGVTPDLLLQDPKVEPRFREADLKGRLPNLPGGSMGDESRQVTHPEPLAPQARFPLPTEFGSAEDVQLARGIEFLQGKTR